MISVVTINKNNRDGLRKTIESVINQTYFDNIEYIIIDGGSTDGSIGVIEEYGDKIAYWVSEPDGGIYSAMNKGVDVSNGEYSIFLNSGDYFCTNYVMQKIALHLDKDIVYGDEYKIKNENNKYLSKYPDKLDESFFRKTALPHQSSLIRTSLLKENKYSEEWKLLGDWKFFREMIMEKGATYKHVPIAISCYGLDGVSTIQRKVHEDEKKEYYKKVC